MDTKSPDAFRTISEVSERLDTPTHVLRFWESRFPQVRPVKRAGGRRYYRPADVALLGGIKKLLHDDGMTIRSVQKMLRDQGIRYVADLGAVALGEGSEDAQEDIAHAHAPQTPVAQQSPISHAPEPAEDLPTAQTVALPGDHMTRIRPTETATAAPASPAPAPRHVPHQPDLFASPGMPAEDTAGRATLACRLHALGPDRLRDLAPELTAIHARLVILRNRMADDEK